MPIENENANNPQSAPEPEITSGKNMSYWLDSVEPLGYSPLSENITVDAVIVGAGISGLTIAYLLLKKGLSVAVIEDGLAGSGETGRTTAHISNALDDRYFYIEQYLGEENAKLAAQSHTAAIHLIEKIVKEENIGCNFVRLDGYLFLHPSDEIKSLDQEHASSRKAGLRTEMLQGVPGIPSETGYCLQFPAQATFHPMQYLRGLAEAIVKMGGRIYTSTHAVNADTSGVKTDKGFLAVAKHTVVATNTPFNDRFAIHTKQEAYRTYVVGALIPKDSLPNALWWDTGDHDSAWPTYPYHYARLQPYNEQHDLLIVGGEDHKTGQPGKEDIEEEQRYNNLISWTKDHFPMAEAFVYKWSGQVMEPIDFMGFIGRNPMDEDNVYVVTGDSGNGMTHGTIAGMLISDLITGVDNPWKELYDPSRKTFRATTDFLRAQGNVAKQFTEYVTKGDVDSVKDILPDEGAIIRNGASKAAVYRDPEGNIHAFTAVCPHLKCIIEWNGDEKTFDCPCHGSRFTALGKVINGPASTDLDRVELKDE